MIMIKYIYTSAYLLNCSVIRFWCNFILYALRIVVDGCTILGLNCLRDFGLGSGLEPALGNLKSALIRLNKTASNSSGIAPFSTSAISYRSVLFHFISLAFKLY
jgi:hypothetical protein